MANDKQQDSAPTGIGVPIWGLFALFALVFIVTGAAIVVFWL